MTLPLDLETEFKNFTEFPKIKEKMKPDKETLMLFGGDTFVELQKEALEQGIMQERERTIMNLYQGLGLSAQQIANTQQLHLHYVQSVIDKFEKNA